MDNEPQEVELTPELIGKILGWVENETEKLYYCDRRQIAHIIYYILYIIYYRLTGNAPMEPPAYTCPSC